MSAHGRAHSAHLWIDAWGRRIKKKDETMGTKNTHAISCFI